MINQYSVEHGLADFVEGEFYKRGDPSFIGSSIGAGDFSSDQLMQNWVHSIVGCEILRIQNEGLTNENRLKSTATAVVIFGFHCPNILNPSL